MIRKLTYISSLTLCTLQLWSLQAQDFQNLSFDSPDPSVAGWPWAGATERVPYWTVHSFGEVGYNQSAYPQMTTLYDAKGASWIPRIAELPLDGQFGFGALPDARNGLLNSDPPWIQQTGLIPEASRSLDFLFKGDILKVFVDGHELPFVQMGEGSLSPVGAMKYGVDVTAWAGKVVPVKFEFLASNAYTESEWATRLSGIDGIQFASQAVPEPSAVLLALAGLGGMLCWCLRHE